MDPPIAPDNSRLRRLAAERGLALAEALARSIREGRLRATLLAAPALSLASVRAAIQAAAQAQAPLLFTAGPSQVGCEGGYAGWTPEVFVCLLRDLALEQGFDGPIVVGLDLGGAWLEGLQSQPGHSPAEAAQAVQQTIRACLAAGYDLLHVRPAAGEGLPLGVSVRVSDIVARTADLIAYAESVRRELGRGPISYEVSAEGVEGQPVDLITFRAFLDGLKPALAERGLAGVWPIFVVASLGRDSGAAAFDLASARRLAEAAEPYGASVRLRDADGLADPAQCPPAGLLVASLGPSLADAEHDALQSLWKMEDQLDLITGSDLPGALEAAVGESGRWLQWSRPQERDKPLAQLPAARRAALVRLCSRFVWTDPLVVSERQRLMKNMKIAGIDGEAEVQNRIAAALAKRFQAFNLNGAAARMEQIVERWPVKPSPAS